MSSALARPDTQDERLAMLAALINGDVALAYRLATELLAQGVAFDEIVIDVLAPVQGELGSRWAAGDLGIAQEHAASAAVEDLLIRLGATAEAPRGPSVVVAASEHDEHSLGARVIASALALGGMRVSFLGASVPATDLADFLDMQQPLALALSVSIPSALVGAARSVAAAHEVGIPVVGGGRALATRQRADRLGFDAHARLPQDAVDILRAWKLAPPDQLATAPLPIPEHTELRRQNRSLVTTALDVGGQREITDSALAEELNRVLQVVESALLVDEPDLLDDHIRWLRDTGPEHGLERARIDATLLGLAAAMDADIPRAGTALRSALA
jgi:methanogenic corrinoid protein MtbC1